MRVYAHPSKSSPIPSAHVTARSEKICLSKKLPCETPQGPLECNGKRERGRHGGLKTAPNEPDAVTDLQVGSFVDVDSHVATSMHIIAFEAHECVFKYGTVLITSRCER